MNVRLTLTRAAVDDDRFSVVAALLNSATVAGTAPVGPRRARASRGHANGDRLLVQANLETHAHILLTVEHPHSILRILGNSVLHSRISLRLARRRVLLQLAFDDLAGSAKVTLEVLGAGLVVDVADENTTDFGLDGALANVDVRSGGRRNVHWSLRMPRCLRQVEHLLCSQLLGVHKGCTVGCHHLGSDRRARPHVRHAYLRSHRVRRSHLRRDRG
jgi:hypothetical protein